MKQRLCKATILFFTVMVSFLSITGCSDTTSQPVEAETPVGSDELAELGEDSILVETYDSEHTLVSTEIFARGDRSGLSAEASGLTKTLADYHYYRTPGLVDETNNARMTLGISAHVNNTQLYVGGDYLGLMQGGSTKYVTYSNFRPGDEVYASERVQVSIWNDSYGWTRGCSILPKRKCGKVYRVPALVQGNPLKVSVVAFESGTHVTAGGISYYLNAGQIKVFSLYAGAGVAASRPISCAAFWGNYNWCRGAVMVPLD